MILNFMSLKIYNYFTIILKEYHLNHYTSLALIIFILTKFNLKHLFLQ